MEISLQQLPGLASIRFFADFDLHIRKGDIAKLSTQQQLLFQAICASPATLHRVACMALEADFAGASGRHLSDLFSGPSNEELLDCFLASHSESDKTYWEELRDAPEDGLHQELMPVFLAFGLTLRRAGLEDLSTSGESARKIVGPTLNAHRN
jgi:hypothetical protein